VFINLFINSGVDYNNGFLQLFIGKKRKEAIVELMKQALIRIRHIPSITSARVETEN
jgi:hypothetical protein